jgi:threonine dehydratase
VQASSARSDRPTGWGDPAVAAPSLDDIRAAAQRLRGRIVRTRTERLRTAEPTAILIKSELGQPTGSFKVRGVLNWALSLSDEEKSRGFSTFSAGNTALALGHAARILGTTARSLLPDYAPDNKVRALKEAGVETVLIPFDEMADWVFSAGWKEEPWTFLHPWTEPRMIAGHGTIGQELVEDLPAAARIYVPVGGGALVAGIGSAARALGARFRIVAVQTESYPSLQASFAAGRPQWIDHQPTICDGVAVPFTTDQMYPLLREVIEEVATVSEAEVKDAIRLLYLEHGLAVEGAGALSVAAALRDRPSETTRAVCLVTGGSIEPELLKGIVGAG